MDIPRNSSLGYKIEKILKNYNQQGMVEYAGRTIQKSGLRRTHLKFNQ